MCRLEHAGYSVKIGFALTLMEQTLPKKNPRSFNPLTPISDRDRISPYNINKISSSGESVEKYLLGD